MPPRQILTFATKIRPLLRSKANFHDVKATLLLLNINVCTWGAEKFPVP